MSTPGFDVPPDLLGYYRDPQWRDMSDYVMHFTDSVDALASILADGRVNAGGPFGWGRRVAEVRDEHMSACLSEIPIDQQDRLVKRHGRYGVGFKKQFVIDQGGGRVWYLDRESSQGRSLFELVGQLMRTQDFNNPLWRLTPFIDSVMPGVYEFEWEREWRVVGGLTFAPDDVAFVVAPTAEEFQHIDTPTTSAAPFIANDGQRPWWEALVQALAGEIDGMAATFLQIFTDPVEFLPWDEGDYVWIVERWTLDDAILEVFGNVNPDVRDQLYDHLAGISPDWVLNADIETFADDAS